MIERYTITTESKFEFNGKLWEGTGTVAVKTFDLEWVTNNVEIPLVYGRTLEEAQTNLVLSMEKITGADKLRKEIELLSAKSPLVG